MLYKSMYFRNEEELSKVRLFIKKLRLESDARAIGVDITSGSNTTDYEEFKAVDESLWPSNVLKAAEQEEYGPDPNDESLWLQPKVEIPEDVPKEVPALMVKTYRAGRTVGQCIEAYKRYREWLNQPGSSGLVKSLDDFVREVVEEGIE